jgi:hypothetical protein
MYQVAPLPTMHPLVIFFKMLTWLSMLLIASSMASYGNMGDANGDFVLDLQRSCM